MIELVRAWIPGYVLVLLAALCLPHVRPRDRRRLLWGPLFATTALLLAFQGEPVTPCVGSCRSVPTVGFGNR